MQVQAKVKDIRVSPRKLRPLLRELKGRGVQEALALLKFAASPHARTVAKVVRSAAANAENNFQVDSHDLKIVRAYANEGMRLKRYRAKARGRVGTIIRRFSHVTVVVEGREG